MTIEELEMRNRLSAAFYADRLKQTLENQVEQYRREAEGIKGYFPNCDAGKSDNVKNNVEDALHRLVELEERLSAQINDLVRAKEEVESIIAVVDEYDLRAVLKHRYLLFHTAEQTAELMGYDVRTVKRKTKQAILKIVTKCHCMLPWNVI